MRALCPWQDPQRAAAGKGSTPLFSRMSLPGPSSSPYLGWAAARRTSFGPRRLPLSPLRWQLAQPCQLTVKKSLEWRGCFGLSWRVDGMKMGMK